MVEEKRIPLEKSFANALSMFFDTRPSARDLVSRVTEIARLPWPGRSRSDTRLSHVGVALDLGLGRMELHAGTVTCAFHELGAEPKFSAVAG